MRSSHERTTLQSMGRRVHKQHEQRRDEILDAALGLFVNQGYAGTTIRSLLDVLDIAKGTLYHYFDSKEAILDALAARHVGRLIDELEPLVSDASAPATERLNTLFLASSRLKVAQSDVFAMLMKAMYVPGNLYLRDRIQRRSLARTTPLLSDIISAGMESGDFDVPDATSAASTILSLGYVMQQSMADTLGTRGTDRSWRDTWLAQLDWYRLCVERLLGAAPGTITLLDPAMETAIRQGDIIHDTA